MIPGEFNMMVAITRESIEIRLKTNQKSIKIIFNFLYIKFIKQSKNIFQINEIKFCHMPTSSGIFIQKQIIIGSMNEVVQQKLNIITIYYDINWFDQYKKTIQRFTYTYFQEGF
ncbi:hypothetical protein pb186bvf_019703 [Paramecium bursaria]